MTVSADATKRAEIAELVNIFEAKVVNVAYDAMTIALADPPEKLDDFEDLMRPYGILEVQRSGRLLYRAWPATRIACTLSPPLVELNGSPEFGP